MGEVGDDRDEDGDDGRVVDKARCGAGDADGREQLAVATLAGEAGHLPADDLDQARSADAGTEDEHREDGERRRIGEPRHALGGGDVGEVHHAVAPEHHQQYHHEDGRHVDGQVLRHEQYECQQDDTEDDEHVDPDTGVGEEGQRRYPSSRREKGVQYGHVLLEGRDRSCSTYRPDRRGRRRVSA